MSEVKISSLVTVDVIENAQPFCVLTTGDGSLTLTKQEAEDALEKLAKALGKTVDSPFVWKDLSWAPAPSPCPCPVELTAWYSHTFDWDNS